MTCSLIRVASATSLPRIRIQSITRAHTHDPYPVTHAPTRIQTKSDPDAPAVSEAGSAADRNVAPAQVFPTSEPERNPDIDPGPDPSIDPGIDPGPGAGPDAGPDANMQWGYEVGR